MVQTLEKNELVLTMLNNQTLHLKYPFLNEENNVEFRLVQEFPTANRVWVEVKEKALVIVNGKKKIKCLLNNIDSSFWIQLNDFVQKSFRILKEFSDRMESGTEYVYAYVVDGKCQLFLPSTMIDYTDVTSKFIPGFVYHLNKSTGRKFNYEEWQEAFQGLYATKVFKGKDSLKIKVSTLIKEFKK